MEIDHPVEAGVLRAVEQVGAGAAGAGVVAAVARHEVVAGAAAHAVVALAAANMDVPRAAALCVVTQAAPDHVSAGFAISLAVALAAHDPAVSPPPRGRVAPHPPVAA